MGDGEFVGNASIHWKIHHTNDLDDIRLDNGHINNRSKGINLTKRDVAGKDPDREATNEFQVTLRFDDVGQARARLQDAINKLPANGNDVYVTLVITALRRNNPNAAPAPEIRVHW